MLNSKIISNDNEYQTCLNIRKQVFIIEQNVPPEIEVDSLEDLAVHFLAIYNEIPIGTARLVKINDNTAKIGRVAILKEYRGIKAGIFLMQSVIDHAKAEGLTSLLLASQVHALGFYEKLGFTAFGKEFMDADIPHYMMRLDIQN